MAAGSLLKPEQFSATDDHTFRVDFVRPDALTLPDIAVVVPAVYNSELVKKNSTAKDPWGLEFTKTNTAGGGGVEGAKKMARTAVKTRRHPRRNVGEGTATPLRRHEKPP